MTTTATRSTADKAETDGKPKGLLPRLHRAQQVAQPVKKQGHNKQQAYDYARAEDVISEASRVLQNEGLIAFVAFTEMEEREVVSKGGGHGLYARVRAELRITDPETGEGLIVEGFGSGIDYPGDKASFKAMTGAAKYAYSSALAMPFSDDPEHDRGMPPAGDTGAPAVSPKQAEFFTTLVGEKAPPGADKAMVDRIIALGTQTFSGGRKGTMSAAIEGLKTNPDATWRELQEAAQAWTPPSDLPPPDTSDLPEPEQETIV